MRSEQETGWKNMRKSLGENLDVNGGNIKTNLKEDVRVELESSTECPPYRGPECGSFITQTACIPPNVARQLGDKIKGTLCS